MKGELPYRHFEPKAEFANPSFLFHDFQKVPVKSELLFFFPIAAASQGEHDSGNIYSPRTTDRARLAGGAEPQKGAVDGGFDSTQLQEAQHLPRGLRRFESHRATGRASAALDAVAAGG